MVRSSAPEAVAQPATRESRAAPSDARTLGRWVREPLLHFLLLGIALFALYGYLQRGRGGESPDRIQLTFNDLLQLDQLFQSQWHRQPTPDELHRLLDQKVQSEVLYREGLALGLDKNDEIVKRRMAQKMQFLAEDAAAAREPSTEELQAWYAKNTDKLALPKRVSFRHLYFSPDRRGRHAKEDAAKALARLTGQPQAVEVDEPSADAFMFQDYYRDRGPDFLGKEFGPQFAQAVAKLPEGSWQGPIESGFGWHLVFVDTAIPGRVPAFEEVEPDVKTAWLADRKVLAWDRAYKEMRAKYTVLLPSVPANTRALPAPPPKVAAAPTSSPQEPMP